MIFRKEKEHGVLTEEEILDMARDIAENDPAYIIGSMLIKSVCDDTGLDEGAAFSMLLDGGGMPKGIAAISARAANDLMRLYKEGGIEGEIDSYLEDERFVRMLLEMPVKAALRLYAAECNADAAAKAEREKGAMDVMEKLAARRAALAHKGQYPRRRGYGLRQHAHQGIQPHKGKTDARRQRGQARFVVKT